MNLGVYLVTDPVLCGIRGVVETVRAAVDGGVRIVQLRDKTAAADAFARQVDQVAEAIAGRALLLINDRLDAAVAARRRGVRVDGVHLGQGDVSVEVAREVLGADALIGLTADTDEHLAALDRLAPGTVDYLGAGVIHVSDTKPDHPPELGLDGFGRFTAKAPLPVVAIGGIGAADVAPLRRVGAAGAAVVSAICAAEDAERAARDLVTRWDAA